MTYTNSPLAEYTAISPNKTANRNHIIDTITIHCVVGQATVQTLGSIFANPKRQASSNYGVGLDGKIGMYVEEKDRSWCSSSAENDNRAVTIEVASDTTEPYAVKDAAYDALIRLTADICRRNGIKKLIWTENKNYRINHLYGCNMTVHRDFAATLCPGTWLYDRMQDIAVKVNKLLNSVNQAETPAAKFKMGDVVLITGNSYYGGKSIPDWVKAKKWIVKSVNGDRVVVDKSEDGKNSINSPIHASDLVIVKVSQNTDAALKVGDTVKLKPGVTKFSNGVPAASFVRKALMYVRALEQNGKIALVSTEPAKAVYTGRFKTEDLQKVNK